MSSNNWRNSLHTFVDENKRVYTVINVPPIINISSVDDSEFLTNCNLGSLLRPRISIKDFPELPYVLCRDPVGDPLLSRLDLAGIEPAHFEGGWALDDDIRNAWIRLEKGLIHVSELLLTSTERSSCGTSARYAIRYQKHWPHPEDYGYRHPHESAHAAKKSIIRSHVAFRLLVARCSLAISLWLFPGADEGRIYQPVTHYDAEMDSSVPDWVSFLRQERVPHSWIDAIRDSVITDFSINLRVGTVVDPNKCTWLAMLPVLRAANIPVFVMWRDEKEVMRFGESFPFMTSFSPPSREVHLARRHPPSGKPRIVTLCQGDNTRPLPDYSAYDGSAPPFGPYQRPGEPRLDFLTRRERYRADQARQESQSQIEWRQQRMARADTGLPPFRRSQVYLWVPARLIYPDLPPLWLGCEYRYPIPPSAYRSLWMVHPRDCRHYNPYYDEWDLWFPPGWGHSREDGTDLELGPVFSRQVQPAPLTKDVKYTMEQVLTATAHDEQELLIPAPEDRQTRKVDFPPNYHLHFWYGLCVADTRTYDDVDYGKWAQRLTQHFAEMTARFPNVEAIRTCIAGWTWAILERKFKSPALTHTWDLDEQHPRYLLREGPADPRSLISMHHHDAPQRQTERDNINRWVKITYQKDPSQSWSLFTSAMGALLLVRHLDKVQTRLEALLTLTAAGIPARTGILLHRPSSPIAKMLAPSVRPLRLPYREEKGERPSLRDYDAYCQRVLELSRRPYVRAAWLKGGIVWRIMIEVTGKFPRAIQDRITQGPSGAVNHYEPVTMDCQGSSFHDDDLSLADLDVIAGAVKIYTGIGAQGEDVSWWPKHHAWVKGSSYTGIWTSADEHWFQNRLKDIYADQARPLNSREWREALRKFKTTGRLATVLENQSWDFTSQYFVQYPSPA